MARLEVCRPRDGKRIPVTIEAGRLFSQCGTIAPGVPIHVVADSAKEAMPLWEAVFECGHENIVVEAPGWLIHGSQN